MRLSDIITLINQELESNHLTETFSITEVEILSLSLINKGTKFFKLGKYYCLLDSKELSLKAAYFHLKDSRISSINFYKDMESS